MVSAQTYSFRVEVSCVVTEVRYDSSKIPDLTYEVDPKTDIPKVIPLPVYKLIPCLTSATYTRTLTMDTANPSPLPAFVSFSDTDGTISIRIDNPTDTGLYMFKVVAKEPKSGLIN